VPIDADELGAWLRLLLVPGVGRQTARQLLQAFSSPQAVVTADAEQLRPLVGDKLSTALLQEPTDWARARDSVLAWLHDGEQRQVITLGDAAYPPALLESPDPPLLLYVQGDARHLSARAVAVVGSRRPTAQGRDNAHAFGQALGAAGYVVVSGLAQGIDGAAHEGALAAGAPTVAVIGTGPDRVYPREHLELARRIAAQGAIVSEYLPGTPPLAENFPPRNRLIAGLSLGTVVIEAALRSGSLITARLANEAGREVFAVPGSIHAAQSRGCHALIRDGAHLVESAAEVLAELGQPALAASAKPVVETAPPQREDPLLAALGHDPISLDGLQARSGWPTAELLARLLELELDGQVARLPGGLFQRRVRA
jgi:DNA processing protein